MKFFRTVSLTAAFVMCMLPFASGCSRIDESMDTFILPDSQGSLSADMEDTDSRYIYDQLSDEEKECYDILAQAVRDYEEEVVFPYPVEPETMKKLFLAVYNQEEDIFWMSSIFFRPAEPSTAMKLSYRYDRETSQRMQAAVDEAAAGIFAGFSEETSDYEKLLTFHDYIVTHCTFSDTTDYSNCTYGALVDGFAQCEGYASAFDYLCSLADIDCFTVTGTNPTGYPHAWNMVKLEGKWYNVDCTWDDPVLDINDPSFLRHYYFLVRDSDISGITHFPDTTYFSLPICSAGDNYYSREGYVASNGEEAAEKMKKAVVDALKNGRKDAAVRFTDSKAYAEGMTRLFDRKGMREVLAYANSVSPKKVLEGRYVRYLNEDEYIIQISMICE